ncbi:MAG: TonB-dependent receptor [Woeseia sp.]
MLQFFFAKTRVGVPPFVSLAFLAALAGPATGQESAPDPTTAKTATPAIDEIVVVASKEPRSIRDVAANVTVVERADIDAILAITADDIFRYTPGIDGEQAGTRFGSESINIRGIGGNRVAVLVDGVPLSDQFDVGSFSNATREFLSTGMVQRIEVLHGPASALYGSSAIGGVIATVTPDPRDLTGMQRTGGNWQSTWRDVDNGLNNTLLLGHHNDGRGVLLGASLYEGDELPSAAADEVLDLRSARRRSGLAKAVFETDDGSVLRLSAIHQDSRVRSDLNAVLGTGRYRTTTALQGDDEYRMQLVNAAWEFSATNGLYDDGLLRAYALSSSVRQTTLDERASARRPVSIDRYFQFDQDTRGLELNLHRTLDTRAFEQRLSVGLEYRERLTEEYRDGLETDLASGAQTNVLLGEVFPLRDFPRSRVQEWGAFVQDSLEFEAVSVVLALRADRFRMRPREDAMYAEDYPFATPVSLSESDLSPKLGVTWHAGDALDLYAQYSHGFRAPPYEDANIGLEIPFFNYRAVPNPELRSESSDALELGARIVGDAFRFNVAVFRADYDDFIESRVRVGTDPVSGRILFQAQNIDRAVISGVEAGWELTLPGRLQDVAIDGSLYLADSENRGNGQALNSVGPAQAVLGVHWQQPDGRRNIRLQATATDRWDKRDESTGELFKPAGYVVADAYLTQTIGERLTLRAAINNLSDRTYWHWSAVRGAAADDPLLEHLAQPGRNYSVNFNLNW